MDATSRIDPSPGRNILNRFLSVVRSRTDKSIELSRAARPVKLGYGECIGSVGANHARKAQAIGADRSSAAAKPSPPMAWAPEQSLERMVDRGTAQDGRRGERGARIGEPS